MEKIEVGDYVRTNDGIIGKLLFIMNEEYGIKFGNNDTCVWKTFRESIVKHSKNIIDLIEVGDYVTIILNESTNETTKFCFESQKQIDILKESECHPIKSIVTKEMFASMEYKVGEE